MPFFNTKGESKSELKKQVAQLNEELDNQKKANSELRKSYNQVIQINRELKVQANDLEKKNQHYSIEINKKQGLEKSVDTLRAEIEDFTQRKAGLEKGYYQAINIHIEKKAQKERVERELHALEIKVKQTSQELQKQETKLQSITQELKEISAKREHAIDKEAKYHRELIAGWRKKHDRANEENEIELQRIKEEGEKAVEKLRQSLEEKHDKLITKDKEEEEKYLNNQVTRTKERAEMEKQVGYLQKTLEGLVDLESRRVKLNVGGTKIDATTDTLCQLPYFQAFLCSEFGDKVDEEGYYFVDRDHLLFPKVLELCRNTKIHLEVRIPTDRKIRVDYNYLMKYSILFARLFHELQFYGISIDCHNFNKYFTFHILEDNTLNLSNKITIDNTIKTQHQGILRTQHEGTLKTKHEGTLKTQHEGTLKTKHQGIMMIEHNGTQYFKNKEKPSQERSSYGYSYGSRW